MCDPLTIAGVALSAGGMAANSIASSRVESANNAALVAERERQQRLRTEAAAVQEQSRQRYEGFQGQQDGRADDLTAYLNTQRTPAQAVQAPAGTTEAPATSSNITTQEETAQRGKADAYAQRQADALGTMRSFGDLLGTASRGQARDAGQIGQLGGFMRGSSGVLPLELDAASHAGDGWSTIGALAGGLGKLGVSAGLGGGFGGGSSTPGGLPTFAAMPGMGASSIANAFAAQPAQPLTLGTAAAALPTFARGKNIYSSF